MLSTGALSPSHQHVVKLREGIRPAFVSRASVALLWHRSPSMYWPHWECSGLPNPFGKSHIHLGFPAQFHSLTPENKCFLGLFIGGPCGMKQEGVLRKKTLHELLTCDLDLSSFPFPKLGWYFNLGIGWLGAGGATQLVPTGFQTALKNSKFSSTALILKVTIYQGKILTQSTLIPDGKFALIKRIMAHIRHTHSEEGAKELTEVNKS